MKITHNISTNRFHLFFILSLFCFTISGCKVNYSFSGADIPSTVKSIGIATLTNKASLVNPTLSQNITNALKDKFQSQTRLSVLSDNGDLKIEGEIVGYNVQPV